MQGALGIYRLRVLDCDCAYKLIAVGVTLHLDALNFAKDLTNFRYHVNRVFYREVVYGDEAVRMRRDFGLVLARVSTRVQHTLSGGKSLLDQCCGRAFL
jgi:hypothetical protein